MGDERRHYLRHPYKIPVKVRLTSDKDSLKIHSADLSEGGMSFFLEEPVPEGTTMEITLPVENRMFKLQGRIAYSLKDPTSGHYRTGVAFKSPLMSFRAKLAEQVLRIQEFRKKVSHMVGHEISEEEAATKWIEKYAQKFAELYRF